ncbi:MAG: hypothetical protein NC122_07160 [Faecalibacterium sp.]|nr:hypothetical protein [Ruminococcus sp.]MCM1391532.1 hypothetical protein [Ruminococcus sp.]MCM1485970.1 hypothetical protein [Faecalibacterium sp.]
MKKTLAVILAVMMMFSCFAVSLGVFAEETTAVADECTCGCEDCIAEKGACHCCIYCKYLDKRYLTDCVVVDSKGNIDFENSFCCDECTGIWPCRCGHDCCNTKEVVDKNNGDPILTPGQQQTLTMVFQNIIKRFADAFDSLFQAIFDFLRIGEIFPDIKI